MNSRLPIALATGSILVLSIALAACKNDGSESLTLEEYFSRLEELDQAADAQQDDVVELLGSEDLDEFRDGIEALGPIISDFADGVADLDPPAGVEAAHSEAAEAARDFESVIDQIVADKENINSLADLDDRFDSEEFVTADERLTASCVALQAIADENSIEADLNCDDEA